MKITITQKREYDIYIEKRIYEPLLNILKNNNIKTVVIGVSGGIDSAVGLMMLFKLKQQRVYNFEIKPYFLNINNQKIDEEMVDLLNQLFHFDIQKVDLSPIFIEYQKNLKDSVHKEIALANIKARMRTTYLYAIANELNAIVCGNLNYDEYFLGFFTKYGDAAVDFHLLLGFLKKHIYELAHLYNIPKEIIKRKPTPSLGISDFEDDESLIGFKYEDLDNYLLKNDIDNTIVDMIIQTHQKNKHKHFVDIRSIKTFKKLRIFNEKEQEDTESL